MASTWALSTDGQRPHQFRTKNDLIKPQQTRSKSNENPAKSTNLIDIRPLITVWLQVRVLAGPTKEAFDLSFQIGFSRTWEDFRWAHTRRKFYEVAEAIGSTWRWSGLLLFKQTGLLFVRSTDSSSLRARSRDGRPRKLLWAIQQHRLMGLRDFCSGNELPQLAQARQADLQ
jgi:hypothetical protein